MHKLLMAASAVAIGLSPAAHATTYNIGPLTSAPYINTATVTGAFSDEYDFSVPATSVAGTDVTVNLDLGSFSYHISNLSLALYDSTNTIVTSNTVSGPTDFAASVSSALAAGNYHFVATGMADGTGTNQGIYAFTTAAVPEAETWAMMLGGIGLIGLRLRRRTGGTRRIQR